MNSKVLVMMRVYIVNMVFVYCKVTQYLNVEMDESVRESALRNETTMAFSHPVALLLVLVSFAAATSNLQCTSNSALPGLMRLIHALVQIKNATMEVVVPAIKCAVKVHECPMFLCLQT
jgi:hypothetical protein